VTDAPRSAMRAVLPALCLGAVLVFTVGLLGRSAAHLPFWYDESLTVRLSRLGSVGELWRAVTAGFEFTPPLIYLATKAARLLPGPETLTARIPGLAGFALLAVFLFIFLRRRLGSWFALAAVSLLPLADYTVRYAIEARAYMLLLGVSAVALVCWQSTAERRSRLAPVWLTISVAVALLLHVWAILLPLALVVGEAVEALRTRRVRWGVVGALLAAAPALVIHPILLRASRTVIFGGAAYEPTFDKLYTAFRSAVPRPRVVALMLVVAFVAGWWSRERGDAPQAAGGLEPAELLAMAVLLLSPLVPYVYAELDAGAFMTRYAMFALPAMVALTGAIVFALAGGRPLAGQSAALVALVGVWLYLPPKIPIAGSQSAALESLIASSGSLDASVPLVLVNPVDVLAFDDQAPDVERARAVFVADSALALKYTGTNGIDLGYERGEPYLNVGVRRLSYEDLTRGRTRLYLLGKWQALSWLPQRLKDDGWALEEIGGTRQAPIFEGRR
jgi:Dolichyl-phosphate-mannose-protein mannosyltransferase